MIRIENIRLDLDEDVSQLRIHIIQILQISENTSFTFHVRKKAVDARHKKRIYITYTVDLDGLDEDNLLSRSYPANHRIRKVDSYRFEIKKTTAIIKERPVIVGTGPCGLFAGLVLAKAGLNPLILERGKQVSDRIVDVNQFSQSGTLNPESNIQFGEGGAGTFSDGKLYTLINDPKTQFIFDILIEAGAPAEIAYDAKPHIGTDNLRKIIPNIRNKIESLGGEFRFESKFTGIQIENGFLKAIKINDNDMVLTDRLILAIGHSARDTYQMLLDNSLTMTPKVFAIGVRIEHLKKWIDYAQYGSFRDHPQLPAGKYKLAAKSKDGRGIYTFCMCPGGSVVPAASEPGYLVTNGMSDYAQDGKNSNSAILVNVYPEDFESDHPLSGVDFQRKWERKAFKLSGSNYHAPVQLAGDFMKNKISKTLRKVTPSYQPETVLCDLRECLPPFVIESIKTGIQQFGRKIRSFDHPEAVLTGVETRSSSPVRLVRDDQCQSNIKGIYPAGEGAGYAGGIISAALDGIRVAESILND